jgi:O-phospho-L-seryl-tRNASec:L-selenocysteinyl-tRNA synthase
VTAGLTPLVLPTVLCGDSVETGDLDALLATLDPSTVLCVLSTTSCFAPRSPDDVEKIAAICKSYNIPHVINNAYGLQCSKITHKIREAVRTGRVDFVVQSTDKNFMVPVGGAIIASPDTEMLAKISELYPGRASISPVLDLFITFLAMGEEGYMALLRKRKEMVPGFKARLSALAEKYGERVLEVRGNTISFALTCGNPEIGSKLFLRRVSGCRWVGNSGKEVCGLRFQSYGSSYEGYPQAYLTAACAVGLTAEEVDLFIERLEKLLKQNE